MFYPILGLTWLVFALYLFLARASLEAAGVAHPRLLVVGACMLAAYDFFRWAIDRRARRRRQLAQAAQKKDDAQRPIVNPEFDFTDPPDEQP